MRLSLWTANRQIANTLAPLIDPIMASRDILRGQGKLSLADEVRQKLNALGIDIRDYPEGSAWTFDLIKHRQGGVKSESFSIR